MTFSLSTYFDFIISDVYETYSYLLCIMLSCHALVLYFTVSVITLGRYHSCENAFNFALPWWWTVQKLAGHTIYLMYFHNNRCLSLHLRIQKILVISFAISWWVTSWFTWSHFFLAFLKLISCCCCCLLIQWDGLPLCPSIFLSISLLKRLFINFWNTPFKIHYMRTFFIGDLFQIPRSFSCLYFYTWKLQFR